MILRLLLVAALASGAAQFGPGSVSHLSAQERATEAADSAVGVTVHGVVVDHETGDSLPGATVSLGAGPGGVRGRGTRLSREGGRFEFEDVPPATYRVLVHLHGYGDMVDTLEVPEEGLELILPMSTGGERLEPVVVEPPLAPMEPGYERRRRGGARFLITREDIVERRPRYVSELLHSVPGGMVVPTPPHGYTLLLRGQCRPGIWMDQVEVYGATSIDQLVTPHDVEAIEVFHGFELPVEFGVNSCGGVLVWTRRSPMPAGGDASGGGDDESGWGLFGQIVRVTALVVALVLLTR